MRKQDDKSDQPELVTREQLFRKVIEAVDKMPPEEKAAAREGFDRYLGLKKS